MDFQKVRALLDGGANPLYRHYDDDSNLLEQCGAECSYQTTCQAGEYIKCPSLWFDSIGYEELGDLFRWAANEQMYQLLDLYVPKNNSEK